MRTPTLPTRPPRDRRYGWFRKYNDFANHPKWDLVATMTCVEKCRVLAIVDCLLIAGNKGRPRGSIDEFSTLECAVMLRIPAEEVRRVYKALEEVGWINQAHLSTWDERQPDREDATTKERSKRYRKRIKEKRQQELAPSRRDGRDATPILDSDLSKSGAVVHIPSGGQVTWGEAEAILKEQRMTQRNLPLLGVVAQRGKR
jgi:hypothetical protein